jgi:hypothetical protein
MMKRSEAGNAILPNTFQHPNIFIDRLMYFLTPEENTVLTFAVRRILGFQENISSRKDNISLSQFTDGIRSSKDGSTLSYGCGLGTTAVRNALENLERYKILIPTTEKPDPRKGQEYWLQDNADNIDWIGLLERSDAAEEKARKQTQKARCAVEQKASDGQHTAVEQQARESVEQQAKVLSDSNTKPRETQGNPPLGGLSEKDLEQANAKVTAMVEASKKVKYENRDKLPEPLLPFSDVYVELTGQKPTKRVLMDWIMTFNDWISEGLQPKDIRAAYQHATRPDGGFLVGRPGSLTNTAVALKSKLQTSAPQINEGAVTATMDMLEEKYGFDKEYVPPPAWVAEKVKEIAAQKQIRKGLRR